eukprot:4909985-Prymnesium_polylepis.1
MTRDAQLLLSAGVGVIAGGIRECTHDHHALGALGKEDAKLRGAGDVALVALLGPLGSLVTGVEQL